MEPFPGQEAASKRIYITSTTKSKSTVHVHVDSLMTESRQWPCRCISCSEWFHKACQDISDSVLETNFVCECV